MKHTTSAGTYEEGIAFALGRLTRSELRLLAAIIDGGDAMPVVDAIGRMEEDGMVNTAWVEECGPGFASDPKQAGIAAVATLATQHRLIGPTLAAFDTYCRIVGIEVDA